MRELPRNSLGETRESIAAPSRPRGRRGRPCPRAMRPEVNGGEKSSGDPRVPRDCGPSRHGRSPGRRRRAPLARRGPRPGAAPGRGEALVSRVPARPRGLPGPVGPDARREPGGDGAPGAGVSRAARIPGRAQRGPLPARPRGRLHVRGRVHRLGVSGEACGWAATTTGPGRTPSSTRCSTRSASRRTRRARSRSRSASASAAGSEGRPRRPDVRKDVTFPRRPAPRAPCSRACAA